MSPEQHHRANASANSSMGSDHGGGVLFNLARILAFILTANGVLATCAFLVFAVGVFLFRRNVPRKFYLLLISRSFADLVVLLVWPFTKSGFFGSNTKLSTLLLPAIINTPHQVILLGTNLTLTSVKNLAITRPLFFRQSVTVGKIGVIVIVIWGIGILSAVPAIELFMVDCISSNVTDLSCAWTKSLHTYITIIIPIMCAIAYLSNVFGSIVLWMSVKKGLKNNELRRPVKSNQPAGAQLFSGFVVKWSIVNYTIFCLPSFFYRVCYLAIMVAMHVWPHGEVLDVIGYQNLMAIFEVLNYLSVVGGIIRIILDALLPFATNDELKAACTELFTMLRQGRKQRRNFGRQQSNLSATMVTNNMTIVDANDIVKVNLTAF